MKFGTAASQLDATAQATVSRTYANTDMCGSPATDAGNFVEPGFLHEVLLTGLEPKTRYYYQYGIGGNYSAVHSFVSAPVVDPDYSFSFVVYADMGITGGSSQPDPSAKDSATATALATKREVERATGNAELVIHAGDVSYARGYAYLWDSWFALIEPYATQVPCTTRRARLYRSCKTRTRPHIPSNGHVHDIWQRARTQVPYMIGIGNHEYDHTSPFPNGKTDPSGATGTVAPRVNPTTSTPASTFCAESESLCE